MINQYFCNENSQDALEPIMSQDTFEYHWGKHHRAYVDNLNKQIDETDLDGKSLEETIVIAFCNLDQSISVQACCCNTIWFRLGMACILNLDILEMMEEPRRPESPCLAGGAVI
ncbi:hypothetical protein KIW84_044074 [Lathyrus oleraceus]|uniref:superoxide dismutase n=1 Tax=Pisum sativum TaxID=3888 RepID=A0A9D4XK37_PEA|nr:hypothetical protein KIW84_044074 [Pisum sativum]